jgi:hypothetical protein
MIEIDGLWRAGKNEAQDLGGWRWMELGNFPNQMGMFGAGFRSSLGGTPNSDFHYRAE